MSSRPQRLRQPTAKRVALDEERENEDEGEESMEDKEEDEDEDGSNAAAPAAASPRRAGRNRVTTSTTQAVGRNRVTTSTTQAAPPSASSTTSIAAERLRELAVLQAKSLMTEKKVALEEQAAREGLAKTGTKPDLVARLVSKRVGINFTREDVAALKPPKATVPPAVTGNPDGWVLLPSVPTRVVEREASFDETLCGVGSDVFRLARSLAERLRSTDVAAGTSVAARIFAMVSDPVFRLVLSKTGPEGAGFSMRTEELAQAVGLLFHLNTSSLSLDAKFPANSKLDKDRFLKVIHAATGFGARAGSTAEVEKGEWTAMGGQLDKWLPLFDAFTAGTKALVGCLSAICLDDDLINFAGNMTGGSSTKTVIPREGEGQSLDVVVWVAIAVAASVTIRRSGEAPLSKLASKTLKDIGGVRVACADRGYTRRGLAAEVAANGARFIGVLNEGSATDQPFSVIDGASLLRGITPEGVKDLFARSSLFTRVSFVGMGQHVAAASRSDGSVAYVAFNRASPKKLGAVLLTEAWPTRGPTGEPSPTKLAEAKTAAARKAATYVRIPGPIPSSCHLTLLTRAPADDATAQAFRAKLEGRATVVSEVQSDAAWGVARKVRVTGSTAALIMASSLNAFPGRWAELDAAVRRPTGTGGQTDHPDAPTVAQLTMDWASSEATAAQNASPLAAPGVLPAAEPDGAMASTEALDGAMPMASTNEALDFSQPVDEDEDGDGDGDPLESASGSASTGAAAAQATSSSSSSSPDVGPATGEAQQAGNLRVKNVDALARLMASSFEGNAATHEGHVQETRAQVWVKDVKGVTGSVLTTGLVCLRDNPEIGVSPDMLALVTKPGTAAPVPAVVEHKSSKHFVFDRSAALNPTWLSAASEPYYEVVPWRFRGQLIVLVAVMGVRHALLLYSAPTGPAASFVIEYTDAQVADVLSLLTSPDVTGCLHDLHMAMRDPTKTTEQILAVLEPQLAPLAPLTRAVFASWLPLCAAVTRYQVALGRAIPPTYTFRNQPTDEYDTLKGGTDNVDRRISDATRAGAATLKFTIETKVTLRIMYYLLVNAYSLTGLHLFFEELSGGKTPEEINAAVAHLTASEVRKAMRRHTGTFPDFASKLGLELANRALPIGMLSMGAREVASPPPSLVTPVAHGAIEVWGNRPDSLRAELVRRALQPCAHPPNAPANFVPGTRLVLGQQVFSPNTPGHRIVFFAGIEEATGAMLKLAWEATKGVRDASGGLAASDGKRGESRRKVLARWDGVGVGLRLSALLHHECVRSNASQRRTCLICQMRTRSPRECSTCNVVLCDSAACFQRFHTVPSLCAVDPGDADGVEDDEGEEGGAGAPPAVGGGLNFGSASP